MKTDPQNSGKMPPALHRVTPLILSDKLTKAVGKGPVFLKLDNLQPSGSFKIRGIGRTCQAAKEGGATKIVGSSGGNAGMAMAYAARKLGMPSQLFIPRSTPAFMVEKIKAEGAEVVVTGANWNEANEAAMECLRKDPKAAFVHPYEQAQTWEGHSSIVTEIKEQLEDHYCSNGEQMKLDIKPAAIVTVVGGGGLAIGILQGMERVGWKEDVSLVTMETEGANCFNVALKENKVVRLGGITSVATSLGALTVCQRLLDLASSAADFRVSSGVVSDREAVAAVLQFADDFRMLVEPACGAGLTAVYNSKEEDPEKNPLHCIDCGDDNERPIVIVVCGGNIASIESLLKLKEKFTL